MDDYNVSVLSEAKNEYSIRLVSILYPLILEGIKSILKEAWELCMTNDEEEKYLMTFQNFLSRVTKWNQTIIDEETARINVKSNCAYLEDLLTCVHITQLKILTSIRVSQRQKKIELDIPKLSDFIHKLYIKCARKFYSSVYLFEQKIPPLEYQKNMRECETICKECILDVIRDNMPVEHILRAYMDESVEEEIIEEIVHAKTLDSSSVKIEEKMTGTTELPDVSGAKTKVADINIKKTAAPSEKKKEEPKSTTPPARVDVQSSSAPEKSVGQGSEEKKEALTIKVDTPISAPPAPLPVVNASPAVDVSPAAPPLHPPVAPSAAPLAPQRSLTFSEVDRHYDGKTKREELITAPKDIGTLEQISAIRNAQRKAEDAEEDEENLKIGDNIDIDLGIKLLHEPDAKPAPQGTLDESVFADMDVL